MPSKSKSNAKKTRGIGLAFGQRRLKCCKVGSTLFVEGADLAIDDRVGQVCRCGGDGRILGGPIEALAGFQRDLTILYTHLHAIAVEFDLVDPPICGGGTLQRLAKLRWDKIRHCRLRGYCGLGRDDLSLRLRAG